MPKLRALVGKTSPKDVRLRLQKCPACGMSVFVKLFDDETGVRCLRCRATPVHLAVIDAVQSLLAKRDIPAAYEMSSRGALLKFLRRSIHRVVTSEYIDGVEPGSSRDGIRCEDVQRLSFPDEQFDLCTSTEVFEHVPDDFAGFREIHRVLKEGGSFVFTVPLSETPLTVERAIFVNGEIRYRLPAAYHGDRLRGEGKVLVFRDYGLDIADRVRSAGFREVFILPAKRTYFGFGRKAIVATR
jgi:SAM-dependent methyltransferase